MTHPMHDKVVDLMQKAIGLMDDFLRNRIDLEKYSARLKELDADAVLVAHQEEFKKNVTLVYYLDALMLLSSLQHELDFQVAEYGANVASEDIRNLNELLEKMGVTSDRPSVCPKTGKIISREKQIADDIMAELNQPK